ncbi:MAG: ABC transporter ATP-binding protein [Clostridiales Family XIII bacterium]|jgi:peptide/nickel transport system ATP-binding protein|nr:ABC transporter ATP-binding protein [Clostridiales Family XIII bacterium]
MGNTDKFLSIRNLNVEYTSGGDVIYAVNGLSLDLERGKSLGLVGETGAGKTTVAKAILRVLPTPPAGIKGGEIFLDGEDILKKPEDKMLDIRGRRISMIFQDPMTALNPTMKIGDQIAEIVRLHSDDSPHEVKHRAMDMLNRVGIMADRFNDYPYQLSGGMKQRVIIAMALVFRPELLLADEPTTALDVTIQAQVLEIIRHFKQKFNSSMILITHDLGIVAENCDTVAVIYAGQIVEYGSLEDVFDRPSHPYTVGLFHSLPGFAVGEARLHPIGGSLPDPRVHAAGCSFYPRCPRAADGCAAGEVPNRELSPGHFCRCLCPEV